MSKKSNMKDWLKTGTKNEIFIKKVLVISVMLLIVYHLGYAIGTFMAHIGL